MMMTSVFGLDSRTARSTVSPSSVPIRRSVRTMSYAPFEPSSTPFAPSLASSTS